MGEPMLASRTPTKEEREWLQWCFQIPCLACKHFAGVYDTPAEYHHTRGKTDPGAHLDGFCLCERHHRISDTQHPKRWISRHGDGKRLFEARYCKEGEFLALQRKEVEALKRCLV